jgi:outer membrane protein OmpA-like peptidoglycan-associated protein
MRTGFAGKDEALGALAADIQATKQSAGRLVRENAAAIEALRTDVENAGKADEARLAQAEQLGAATAARIEPLAAGLATLERQVAVSNDAMAKPAKPGETAREQFLSAINGVAVFFTAQDDFVNPEMANARLDAIASALKQSGEGIRVVGYADDTGGAPLNAANSNKRAAKVARLLVERGIPADKIVAVARAAQMPIANSASPQHARNRRVTFEALLSDEIAP